MRQSLSKRIGETFAHLQDFFDTLIQIGFKRMKDASEKTGDLKNKRTSMVGKTLRFFSEVGDSFYTKYTDIKSEKNSETSEEK